MVAHINIGGISAETLGCSLLFTDIVKSNYLAISQRETEIKYIENIPDCVIMGDRKQKIIIACSYGTDSL